MNVLSHLLVYDYQTRMSFYGDASILQNDKAVTFISFLIPGSNEKGQYLGCFKDSFVKRDVGNFVTNLKEDNSPQKCVEICINGGRFF